MKLIQEMKIFFNGDGFLGMISFLKDIQNAVHFLKQKNVKEIALFEKGERKNKC